jgi:phage-related protein (TIGR01555 family)
MLTKLRARVANWLNPPPAPKAAPPKRMVIPAALMRLAAEMATQDAPMHPKRPDRPTAATIPDLPAGVLPRDPAMLRTKPAVLLAQDGSPVLAADGAPAMDAAPTFLCVGEVERTTLALDSFGPSWGYQGSAQGYGGGLWFPGYPYLSELTQISEYRAPCETVATEMTRKWFKLQSKSGGDKSEVIAQIEAECERLKVREKFYRAALLDCEFGRGQIYLNINDADDQARQKPLEISPAGIPKGSLKSIACFEPYWSTPYSWNASYPEREDFYKPTSWYIMGRKTHADRILTFISHEVPDLLKPMYNFSGISLIQLGEMAVNMWLRTRKSVNDLINNFSMLVLSTDLQATLEDGAPDGSGLLARLNILTATRNNQGVNAINKDTEEMAFAEASLASLDKLQAQSQEHMAAVWHTPLVKIFGVVPTGLNATSEGEIQVWYDWIMAQCVHLYQPNLQKLLNAIQCSLLGKIDDDIVIHWVTLDEPTQKELSEIRKSDADMDTGYINAGVISPDEARVRLQSDPDSGYSNLTGGPPEPPEPEEPTTDPEGDATREHEASEADKQRQHETGQAALKTAAAAAKARAQPAVPIKAKTGP